MIFLKQMAKLLMYASYSTMANVMFAMFSLIFIVTRLIILPNWLVYLTHHGHVIKFIIAGSYPV